MSEKDKVIVCYNCGKECNVHKCSCGAEDWQCECGCGSGHSHDHSKVIDSKDLGTLGVYFEVDVARKRIVELEQQLAEKDKLLEAFKNGELISPKLAKQTLEMRDKLLKQERHQVCEEIGTNLPVYTAKIKGVLYAVVKMYDLKYILDQIEKGE